MWMMGMIMDGQDDNDVEMMDEGHVKVDIDMGGLDIEVAGLDFEHESEDEGGDVDVEGDGGEEGKGKEIAADAVDAVAPDEPTVPFSIPLRPRPCYNDVKEKGKAV